MLIYPRWRLPYYTRQAPYEFTPDGDYPTTQSLLIYCRWRLPYYTSLATLPRWELLYYASPANVPKDGDYPTIPSAANLSQMDITVLYQTGLANLSQMEITLLHHPC